jgi:hypothetical protein
MAGTGTAPLDHKWYAAFATQYMASNIVNPSFPAVLAKSNPATCRNLLRGGPFS